MCYVAIDVTDVCPPGMLLTSSVYMGNGWFGRAVMPLMACLVRAFVNRASPWGLAGFDVIGVAPKISARYVDRGCSQNPECGSRVLFNTQGIDSWDEKEQRLLWDSVSKCALECAAKYLKPQRLRHMLQTKLARLGD